MSKKETKLITIVQVSASSGTYKIHHKTTTERVNRTAEVTVLEEQSGFTKWGSCVYNEFTFTIIQDYNLQICIKKSKFMAVYGKEPIRYKIVMNDQPIAWGNSSRSSVVN